MIIKRKLFAKKSNPDTSIPYFEQGVTEAGRRYIVLVTPNGKTKRRYLDPLRRNRRSNNEELEKSYSEKEEKDSSKKKGSNKSIAVGASVVGLGHTGRIALSNSVDNDFRSKNTEEGEKLFEKIKKLARKKKIKVDEMDSGSPYYSMDGTIHTGGTKYQKFKDGIIHPDYVVEVKSGNKRHGFAIAHELGHAHFDKGKVKGIGEKLGKAAHRYYLQGRGSLISQMAGGIAGGISGRNKARLEEKGEKESKVNRYAGLGTAALTNAPILASEAAASKYGLNVLKKAGASKEYLKGSKKTLLKALGSYAGLATAHVGASELARGLSYRQEKKRLEKKKKGNK